MSQWLRYLLWELCHCSEYVSRALKTNYKGMYTHTNMCIFPHTHAPLKNKSKYIKYMLWKSKFAIKTCWGSEGGTQQMLPKFRIEKVSRYVKYEYMYTRMETAFISFIVLGYMHWYRNRHKGKDFKFNNGLNALENNWW